jgi:putative DNA primase/helicase
MALSLSSVSGGLFFEYIVPESRKVLLIDGEMSISDIQYRLKKLNKGESLPENLSLLSSEFLALDNKTLNINEQEYQEQIIEALEENKPDVVVFDNLSSLSYGNDENSNSDLDLFLKFIGKLRHKGIAVVIVHHAGKNGKLRGASRLEDRMDYTIKLTKGKKTKKGGACFDFEFTKCRGKTPHPYKVSVELIEHDGKLSWCHEKVEKKITINDEILHYLSMGTFSTQKEIADKMDKDKSIISKGVKALKEKNYINGEQKLTALGKEYHTEIKGHFNDYDYTDVL